MPPHAKPKLHPWIERVYIPAPAFTLLYSSGPLLHVHDGVSATSALLSFTNSTSNPRNLVGTSVVIIFGALD
jgi:hypothetical protein